MDEKTLKEKNKELVDQFFDLINKMGNVRDLSNEFSKKLKGEHRYLQSEAVQLFHKVLNEYAGTPNNQTDARNVWAVKWSRAVRDLDVTLKENELQGL